MTLSLLAKCGELLVALDATQVFQIHASADLPARQMETNLWSIELDRQTIPGWDLGQLFSYGQSTKAWVLVDAKFGGATRRFGLRVDHCVTVRKLPTVRPLPSKLYTARPGALAGAFSTEGIDELAGTPTGVLVDLAKLLAPAELEAGGRIARDHGGRE
ncbi:MAG TPA: hypothetical protein VGM90_03200 [Kofleriaceae bacterium]